MTGNKIIDIILGAISIAVAAGVVFLFHTSSTTLFNRPTLDAKAEKEALENDARGIIYPRSYHLRSVIVNLKSRTKRLRFLEVDMHLTPFDDMDSDKLESNKHLLRDEVISLASTLYPKEINSITGKLLFEERIKNRFNDSLKPILGKEKTIRKIYFSKFVVQ